MVQVTTISILLLFSCCSLAVAQQFFERAEEKDCAEYYQTIWQQQGNPGCPPGYSDLFLPWRRLTKKLLRTKIQVHVVQPPPIYVHRGGVPQQPCTIKRKKQGKCGPTKAVLNRGTSLMQILVLVFVYAVSKV